MFYIRLPYFYQNYQFNTFFKKYIYNHPNCLKAKMSVSYCYGAFPWSIWNGGHNVHTGEAVLVPKMQELFLCTETPICLDFSNTILTENDIYDIHENATLKAIANTGFACEVSDISYMNYVLEQDKTLNIIISDKAQAFSYFTEPIINTFCDQDRIELVNINSLYAYDLEAIENKGKIELTVGCCAKCDTETQLKCSLIEQSNIYNYSGKSVYVSCDKIQKQVDFYEAIKPSLQQGITHFKLETPVNNLKTFNMSVLTSFIKPECLGDCLIEYYEYCK